MQRMMGDAMEEGAWGLSTGLIYAPGSYATTEEIIEVAKAAARSAASTPATSAGKARRCWTRCAKRSASGARAELPVQISHIKAAGRPNWGKVADALALIDEARAEGLDVMADVYPYTASSTTLRTLLPDWALEGGIDAMLKRLADPRDRERIRARSIARGRPGPPRPDRLGQHHGRLVRRREDARGQPSRRSPRRRHRPARRRDRADRRRGRQGRR